MKRKQVLALLLSASVLGTTILPVYAEGESIENNEMLVSENIQDKENTDIPKGMVETEIPDETAMPTVSPEERAFGDDWFSPEVEEKPLENGADFMADGVNYVGLYKYVDDNTVDLVYIDERKVNPDYAYSESYDLTNIVIASTVEKDGKTYQVRAIDLYSNWPVIEQMKNVTIAEGIQSINNIDENKMVTLTLPSTLTYYGQMYHKLPDGTPYKSIKNKNLQVNFTNNSELEFLPDIKFFVSAHRGSGACENVGDQFKLNNFTFEVVEPGVVDIVKVYSSDITDNANMVFPANVSYNGYSFAIRNVKIDANSLTADKFKTLTFEEGIKDIYFEGQTLYPNVTSMNIPSTATISRVTVATPSFLAWNVAKENPYLESNEGILYTKGMTELIHVPCMKIMDTFEVPSSVTTIKMDAFGRNMGITNLIVPETVKVVEEDAISYLFGLKSMTVEGTKDFGQNNMSCCPEMETLTIKNVDKISFRSISNNEKLKVINVEGNTVLGGLTTENLPSLEKWNVTGTTKKELHSADGVLCYGYVMWDYPAAKKGDSFVVPNYIKRIDHGSFDNSKYLKKVIMPEGVLFDGAAITNPKNPIDVYLSDRDKIHFVRGTENSTLFESSVGGRILAPTQETLDSIPASAMDGFTAEIGVVPVERVEVSSENITIKKGKTQDLEVKTFPEYATERVSFETSGDFCTVSEDGVLTANKAGKGTVTVKGQNGDLKVIKVTVFDENTNIQFTSEKYSMNKGDSKKLELQNLPEGVDIADVKLESANKSIAIVDQNGKVTAIGAGTTTITATLYGKTATCEITVKVPLESITMSESSKTVNKGESFDLDIIKAPVDTTVEGNATWKSDDKSVAKVDQNGKVTAVGRGTTTITATLDGKTTTCEVTVKVPLESIEMTTENNLLNKGESLKLDFTKAPADTTETGTATWESENNSIATVNENGIVTAVSAGTTTIKATLNGKVTTTKVTVKVPLESITMSEANKTVNKGESFDLDITKAPVDTTVEGDVAWTSDDSNIATVDQNGKVTAMGAGTTIITATLNGKEASCEVSVKVPLESIELSDKVISLVEDGTANLNVIYNPTDTTVEKDVTWNSDHPEIVSVNENGSVTAKAVGRAIITATVDGKSASCIVNVDRKEIALDSISLSKSKVTLTESEKVQVSVKYNPINTTVDKKVTWSSSNDKVATVDEDGTIVALKAGKAIIKANVAGKEAKCEVIVKAKEIALDSISLSATDLVMKKGDTTKFDVKYNPTNTTVDKKVTWSSSDDKVATVDENGVVTAKSEGNTIITANVNGKTAECKITVREEKPEVADKTALKDAIDKAEKEAEFTDKYTEESIAAVKAVVEEAKALLEKEEATQSAVDAMVEKVNKAVEELSEKPVEKPEVADKTALKEAIDKAEKEAGFTDKYTEESIAAVKAVVEEAKALLEKEEATQLAVDEMIRKIENTMAGMVENPGKPEKPALVTTELRKVIKKAETEVGLTDKYTAKSIERLSKVLIEAKELLNTIKNSNVEECMMRSSIVVTQKDIDAMVNRLYEAIEALELKVEIPMTPLEPAIPVEPGKPEIPMTPLEPAIPVEKPERPEISLTPLEPATPAKKPEKEHNSDVPKTGDVSNVGGLMGMLSVSLAGIGKAIFRKRKKDE